MAVELFDNATSKGTQRALASPLSAAGVTANVDGPASTALQAGQFRAIIIDLTNGNYEYVIVTGGQWANQWQIERGAENSTPLDFPAGSIIKHVLTVGGLQNIMAQNGGVPPSVQVVPFFANPDVTYNAATWEIAFQASAFWGATLYNLTNAQNDGGAWKVDLAKGTWTLYFMSLLASNQAIATIDISFDNGTTWLAIGTADLYGSGANRFIFTGIAVPPLDGPALVRFRALTRNGSATGWILALSGMEWVRTA